MNTEPSTDAPYGALRSWWQLGAAGLAVASALVWLVAVVTMTSSWEATGLLPADGQLDAAAGASYWAFLWQVAGGIAGNLARLLAEVAPAVVLPIVVPAVGAWLARRREPVRARLGLATLVAWGGLFALVGMVSTVVGPVPRHPPWLVAGTLGLAALAAALQALRVHPGPSWLGAPTTRTVAAAAIAVWGMARLAAAVLYQALASVPGAPAPAESAWLDQLVGFELPGLVAVLAVAVVVWRRDTVLAIPMVVVAIQAVMSLTERWAPATSPTGPRFEPTLPEIAGIRVDAAVEGLGAVIIVAAAAGLVGAARAEWYNRRLGSVPAERSPP